MNDNPENLPDRPQPKAQLTMGGPIAALVPRSIEEVFRLAQAVVTARMTPFGMDTPEKVTIAILTGLELGVQPMQAVQGIAIINNRPTVYGDLFLAVVRASPLCIYVKEWIEGEGDGAVAHCETLRKGETEPVRRTFSARDAMKAGLWQTEAKVTKRKADGSSYTKENDSPWYRYPQRMLQMRARAWCLRDTYADVTKGVQMREEVEDYSPESAKDVTPANAVMERLKGRLTGAKPPETAQDGQEPQPAVIQPDEAIAAVEGISGSASGIPEDDPYTEEEKQLLGEVLMNVEAAENALQLAVLADEYRGQREHSRPEVQARIDAIFEQARE